MSYQINTITPEQESRFPEWVEKWVNIGLSTEPIDFNKAKEDVCSIYKAIGLKTPVVLYAQSPYEAVVIGNVARLYINGLIKTGCFPPQVASQVASQVWSQVWSQVASQVGSSNNFTNEFKNILKQNYSDFRYGSINSSWYSYISFLRDVLGWENNILKTHQYNESLAQNSLLTWYHDNVAVVCDRPLIIRRNVRSELHNESGPALEWRSGEPMYCINGITVNEKIVIAPHTQTIEEIEAELNNDVKSIRIERYGWMRYLKDIRAGLVDKRNNDIDNTKEALFITPNGLKRFIATCPTGKLVSLSIPNEIQTCEQAQFWLANDVDKKYNVIGRT